MVRVATERENAVSSSNLSETCCQPPHPLTPHPTCWGRIRCEVHLGEPSVAGGGSRWGAEGEGFSGWKRSHFPVSRHLGPPSRDPLLPSSAVLPAVGHLSHPQNPLPAGISLQSQEWGREEARGPPQALETGGPATQTLSSGWASPDDDHPPLPRPGAPDAVFTGGAEETLKS